MPKEIAERMDQYFAVFNLHVNDARDRANAEFVHQFGQEVFDEHIRPRLDEGIMSLFNEAPTKHTMAWVVLVTVYVNEDRAPKAS